MYILDAVNKHLKPSQIVNTIIDLHYKWGFKKFGMETNFFKGTIEEDLKRAIKEERDKNPNFQGFSVEPLIASAKQRNWNRVMALQP